MNVTGSSVPYQLPSPTGRLLARSRTVKARSEYPRVRVTVSSLVLDPRVRTDEDTADALPAGAVRVRPWVSACDGCFVVV